ncbi:YceD family protein [Dankookia sp. GCM10030260]|uniref:YceD family protein n=1 Tax=Dankookia sp. GCM10030260 TaxID=3273390 RepID=UPI00361B94AE
MPPEAPKGPIEFSRPLPLGRVGPEGRTEALVATAAECAALARRFGILGVDSLRATLRLEPDEDGAVVVTGRLEAAVVQACVVTLEPVPQRVAEEIVCRLLPAGREPAEGPDDPDEIECAHDVADLGEVVAEQLALALDPYPRAAGAELPAEATDDSAGAFAALAALRRKV